MPLSGLRLETIQEHHLQGLIADGASEGRRLDFKELVETGDEAKREFLADVSSFANAAGGDLFIGVAESSGVASGLPSLKAGTVAAGNETIALTGERR